MSEPFNWEQYLGTGDGEQRPIVKWDAPGKVVKGTIAGIRTHDDKKYGKGLHPVIDVDGDEPCTLFVSQVGLQRSLAERNPQVGDEIAIRFDGTEKLENGNSVNKYTVKVVKPDAPKADVPPPSDSDFSEEPF